MSSVAAPERETRRDATAVEHEHVVLMIGYEAFSDYRRRERKSLNRVNLDGVRRSIKGGSGESVAALSATGRLDCRRSRGRMAYATIPAKSAKNTTITTDTASVVISGLRLPRVTYERALRRPFSISMARSSQSRGNLVGCRRVDAVGRRGTVLTNDGGCRDGPGTWLVPAAVVAFLTGIVQAANKR
jgi:hypothetical protein